MTRLSGLIILIILFSISLSESASGQIIPNATCSESIPFCTTDLITFAAGVNTGSPESGPCYSCWGTQQNPAWFYMQIENSGSILIHMVSNPLRDIDYCCWGPFTSPTGACAGGLTCDKVVSCSYSPNPWEDCSIPNGKTGEFYILCIANFSNQPCEITFSQTGGTGTLNCNIVFNCSMLSLSPVASACDAMTNTFNVTGSMEFSNPPATGTLTISDNTGASQTFTAPFNTPQPYTLTGITCDGLSHTVTATFSDSPTCMLSANYNSPDPVCPSAHISGGGPICNDGVQNANVLISFPVGSPPFTFVYAIDGVSQPPVTHPTATDYQLLTKIPGVYTLVSVANLVCPGGGGTVSGSATVTLLPLPTALVSGTTAVCTGSSAPTITFTGGTGTAPFTFFYNINGGSTLSLTTTAGNSATVSQSTASPGTFIYTLESVTDANGCFQSQTGSATITVNPLPTATISGDNAVCPGATDPKVTFTGGTGTQPYTFYYNINGSATQSVTTTSGNSATVSQSTTVPGTFIYTLESVTDVNNCSQLQGGTATITVYPLPTASISGDAALCPGSAAPLITFTGATGTAPYTFSYNINGGATQTVTTTSGNTATVSQSTASPGVFIYSLQSITDANGCSQLQNGTVTITIHPLPTASISGTLAVCTGATSPVVTFTGATGPAPFTFYYKVNGGTTQSVTTTSGNSVTVAQSTGTPGTFVYSLESVTDGYGCSQPQTGTATITVRPLPTATIAGNNAVCSGATAPLITFTGGAGTAPYTFYYKVNGGATQSVTTTSGNTVTVSQSTATAGTYVYTLESVADVYGCSQTQPGTVTITVYPLPTATITGNSGVCTGANPPVITFTGAAGTAPYTFYYKVNGGATQSVTTTTGNSVSITQSAATPGTYIFSLQSVSDANSCSQVQSGSVTITVFPLPTALISGSTSVCSGAPAPDVTFAGATGTAPFTFSYKINNGATQSVTTTTGNTATVSQSTALPGTYIYTLVSVTDGNGCFQAQTGTVTITVYPLPTATISGTTAVCTGATPPAVTFTGATGSSPYTFYYRINSGPTQSVSTTAGNSVSVTQPTSTPGTYIYTLESVTDLHSCSNTQSGTATITVNPLPTATVSGPAAVCLNAASPNIVFTGASATPPYIFTYNINGGPALNVTSTGNTALVPVPTGSVGPIVYNLLGVQEGSATACYQAQSGSHTITVNPLPVVSIIPCFDVVTNRSAKRFLLKGGKPVLTATPMQGEYMVTPATPALTSDASGNYYFEPALVPGTNTVTFSISYRYTSSQFGCTATSPSQVSITVHGANPACGTTLTDYRDNPPTTYRTAFLAGKCWMTENLRYGSVLFPISNHQTDNCTTEKYCLPADANCTAYGGLYQWDELIQYGATAGPEYQGVCPAGWHIPSAADYQALIDANLGNGMAGSFLKDLNLNPRGFEAMMKGMAYLNTAWAFTATDIPPATLFWTSTPGSNNRIVTRGVNTVVPSVQFYEAVRSDAFPVRCVKD